MVMERLDRDTCSNEWKMMFPISIIKHLEFWGSDHRPIVLEASEMVPIVDSGRWNGRKFFFEECWANEEECANIVSATWKNGVSNRNVELVISNIK